MIVANLFTVLDFNSYDFKIVCYLRILLTDKIANVMSHGCSVNGM